MVRGVHKPLDQMTHSPYIDKEEGSNGLWDHLTVRNRDACQHGGLMLHMSVFCGPLAYYGPQFGNPNIR